MSEHGEKIQAFLASMGWADADRSPIAGDMSSRRYTRLIDGERSAILMDADADQTDFLRMTVWLGDLGLSVPQVIGASSDRSLILLEDLGRTSLKALLDKQPSLEKPILSDCIDLLLHIRTAEFPALSRPAPAELVDWTRLADEYYPGIDSDGLTAFRGILKDVLDEAVSREVSVSLRDFHAENIMWLTDRHGFRRMGLLDYQDAFLTHPAYDLVSLLTDARRRVSPHLREEMIELYVQRSGDGSESIRQAFAAFAAQRNLRILGVFARAGRHMALLPNVYRYFAESLDHAIFSGVRESVLTAVPAPEGASK